ncbi:MAG TPA: hypothetical protein VGB50_03740 [Flavobacterium sp.]|jgi:hypothetical protein
MKKLLVLSALVVGMFSCSDDDVKRTDDLTGQKIAGFETNLVNVTHFEDIGAVTVDIPVKLFGLGNGQLPTSDIVINYSIDTENTTAVQGQEFSFGDTSGQIVIPAGSDFNTIPLVVNTGQLNPSVATSVVLNLSSPNGDVIIGEQWKQVTVNFVGCVSAIQEGSYTATRGPLSTIGPNTTYQDVITMVGTNTFTTAHTPPYIGSNEDPAGLPSYGFLFEDVCGEITVSSGQTLFDYYSNPVEGVSLNNGVLNDQQGVVVDANTFIIYMKVGGTNTYYTYITYTKNP